MEFYIDNLVGVYDDFETDTAAPTIDFGRANASGIMNVNEGSLPVSYTHLDVYKRQLWYI